MDVKFGMKELYSVVIKPTYPVEIGGIQYAAGEVIASFDKIMIANFKQLREYVIAHGGFMDRALVTWETTKGMSIKFTQGVFSTTQLALMSNNKIVEDSNNILISQREEIESDENGIITLKHAPADSWIFIYNKESGEKITGAQMITEKEINIDSAFTDVIVDYQFMYEESIKKMIIGQEFIDQFLILEGKTKVKDDITGQVRTGIIKIPKLKLTSDLSIALGADAQPVVGSFEGICMPTGNGYQSTAMEIVYLNDDVDSDF